MLADLRAGVGLLDRRPAWTGCGAAGAADPRSGLDCRRSGFTSGFLRRFRATGAYRCEQFLRRLRALMADGMDFPTGSPMSTGRFAGVPCSPGSPDRAASSWTVSPGGPSAGCRGPVRHERRLAGDRPDDGDLGPTVRTSTTRWPGSLRPHAVCAASAPPGVATSRSATPTTARLPVPDASPGRGLLTRRVNGRRDPMMPTMLSGARNGFRAHGDPTPALVETGAHRRQAGRRAWLDIAQAFAGAPSQRVAG